MLVYRLRPCDPAFDEATGSGWRNFSVDEIFVTSCEKKYYAGSVAWEYKCRIVFRNQQRLVTLLFQPETCRWKVLAG